MIRTISPPDIPSDMFLSYMVDDFDPHVFLYTILLHVLAEVLET